MTTQSLRRFLRKQRQTYLGNTLGPGQLALVALVNNRPVPRTWFPIRSVVQLIGGRRWSLAIIRLQPQRVEPAADGAGPSNAGAQEMP